MLICILYNIYYLPSLAPRGWRVIHLLQRVVPRVVQQRAHVLWLRGEDGRRLGRGGDDSVSYEERLGRLMVEGSVLK